MSAPPTPFHTLTPRQVMEALDTSPDGLSPPQAQERLERFGPNALAAANRYIAEVFSPEMNGKFAQEAAEPGSVFVGAQGADLVRIFAIRHEDRTVANDNTVRVNNLTLQIEPSRFRHHFAKCRVDVLEHLNGTSAVVWKKRGIGRYDVQGQILRINPRGRPPDPRGLSLSEPGKRRKRSVSAPSPAVPGALGSLPSVALSSPETTA